MGQGGSSPGGGPRSPTPPQPPRSREAIIVIFCHLLGKLQVLLLPLASLLRSGRRTVGSHSGHPQASERPRLPFASRNQRLPQPTPSPCCRILEGTSWPGAQWGGEGRKGDWLLNTTALYVPLVFCRCTQQCLPGHSPGWPGGQLCREEL